MGQIYNSLTWQEMNKAQAVPLNGVKVPLGGELLHQSLFHASLISEQGCMEGLPKSSVFALSCVGLTSSGYVGQTRKNSLCKDELLFMCYMAGDRFSSMMEDLSVCTHILNVPNNKDSNSNYSALNVF